MRSRAVRHGFLIAAAVYVGLVALGWAGDGIDAHAYWVLDLQAPYGRGPTEPDAFNYSPVAALVIHPLTQLPWTLFLALVSAATLAALYWIAGEWAIVLAFLPFVAMELLMGNINLLLGAAVALGFRYPAAWSIVILTKVTPGIGLLWFVFRREWRHLGIALGTTGALAAASLVVAPELWGQWMEFLVTHAPEAPPPLSNPEPFGVRLVGSVVILALGARANRPEVVPVAAMLAVPILWGPSMALAALAVARKPWLVQQESVSEEPAGPSPLRAVMPTQSQ